jgi:hypothetical protein
MGTVSFVLIAFVTGHLAARWGASIATEALVAIAVVVLASWATRRAPADAQVRDGQPPENAAPAEAPRESVTTTSMTTTSDQLSRLVPNGLNTFDVVCSPPASETALSVIQDVIDGMVRPTDLVVRHTDGRLVVVVDAAGEDVRQSFESRANVHVHVALTAAGMSPVGLTLRPVGSRD